MRDSTFAGHVVDFCPPEQHQSESRRDVAVATAQIRNVPRWVAGQDGSDWQNRRPVNFSLPNVMNNGKLEVCRER